MTKIKLNPCEINKLDFIPHKDRLAWAQETYSSEEELISFEDLKDLYDSSFPLEDFLECEFPKEKLKRIIRIGDPKKRRTRWNHKYHNGMKSDTTRTFKTTILTEIIPGGLEEFGNYWDPNGKLYSELSGEEARFLGSIYKDPNSGRLRYFHSHKYLKNNLSRRFPNLVFQYEDSKNLSNPRIFVKKKVSKMRSKSSKSFLRKGTEASKRREFGESCTGKSERQRVKKKLHSPPFYGNTIENGHLNISYLVQLREVNDQLGTSKIAGLGELTCLYGEDGKIKAANYYLERECLNPFCSDETFEFLVDSHLSEKGNLDEGCPEENCSCIEEESEFLDCVIENSKHRSRTKLSGQIKDPFTKYPGTEWNNPDNEEVIAHDENLAGLRITNTPPAGITRN